MARSLGGVLTVLLLLTICGARSAPEGYYYSDLFPEPLPIARDTFTQRIALLRAAGRYEEALSFAREVLKENAASMHPTTARGLRETVAVLDGIVALPSIDRRRLAMADSIAIHVVLAWRHGRYVEGTGLCERVLAARREVLGPEHPDVAWTLQDLGSLYAVRGRNDRAEPFLREALAMRRRILGPNHYLVAETLHWLGELLFETGRFDAAESLLVEAVEVRRAEAGVDDEELDRDLLEIAQIHMQRGNFPFAQSLLEQALIRTRRHRGERYWLTATLLENLARIAERRGELSEAEPLRRRALEIRRAVLDPDHPHIARSLTELGLLLAKMERFGEAETCLREALATDREFQGAESPEAIAGMKALGYLLEVTGALSDAESHYRDALALDRRLLGDQNPDVASDLMALARVRRLLGDLGGAAGRMAESLTLYRSSLGDGHPALAAAWYEDALIDIGNHAWTEAERSLAAAAGVFETARVKVGDGYARASFAQSPYGALAAVRLILGRGDAAWDAVERCHGRALADLLWATGVDSPAPAALPHGRALLAETPGDAYDVCSLAQVRAALDGHTAIIGVLEALPGESARGPWGYVIRQDRPLAWVDLSAGLGADRGAVGHSPVTMRTFQEELTLAAAWPFRVSSTERIDAEARSLWRLWFQPFLVHLDGVDRLVVIPTGPLAAVPVEALMALDGRRVVDAFSVSYIPSATIFVALGKQATKRRIAPDAVLLVGDPAFTNASPELLRDLPGTRIEIDSIARLFPSATVLAGAEASEETLHEMAKTRALARFDVIHLATHALADDQHPDNSGLFLSRSALPDPLAASRAGRIFDGVLTAGEVVREWRLTAELVTLSSCETARGKPTDGEGFVGLAHAFLRAGARSLLVSLWPVEDEATALLMSRFYENLRARNAGGAGADRAVALQEAKRWLRSYRDATGEQPFRHPAYWSAFVLIGES